MCRLFASIGIGNADEFLREKECSLLAQSNSDPEHLQQDGWGVASFSNGWRVLRSTTPVFNDPGFSEADAEGGIVIAHIRRASNPLDLPIEELRAPENIQPYRFGEIVFAHNGTVKIPEEMRPYLGEFSAAVQGKNDSEIYFWLLMKNLQAEGDMKRAVLQTVADLNDAWKNVPQEKREKLRAPYRGLNFVMSDGKKVYAYCRHDAVEGAGPTLCYKDAPYYWMVYREESGGLVVASERMDREKWKEMRDGELLEVWVEEGMVNIKLSTLH